MFSFYLCRNLEFGFSFSQECINEKKLMEPAPLESPESNLGWQVSNLCSFYRFLTNLHEKVLENYSENLQKYLIELKRPYSAEIK